MAAVMPAAAPPLTAIRSAATRHSILRTGTASAMRGSLRAQPAVLGLAATRRWQVCIAWQSKLEDLTSKASRSLKLAEILEMREPECAMKVLCEELPIRYAHRIAQLNSLPYVEEIDKLREARDSYNQSLLELTVAMGSVGCSEPSSSSAEAPSSSLHCPERFAEAIQAMQRRHMGQEEDITLGIQTLGQRLCDDGGDMAKVIAGLDSFLDRFYLSRIGIQTLVNQYLGLLNLRSGIVDPNCDPCEVCRSAADHVQTIALESGVTELPQVEVSFHGVESARTLPLISQYLFYIVVELLKNSHQAINNRLMLAGERCGQQHAPQKIRIRVSSDEEQVALQISDKGGGISFADQLRIWSFFSSSRPLTSSDQSIVSMMASNGNPLAPLTGYGVGLPLSRLYAEYIGGSLQLVSMPNFGTHAFLFLRRCSSRTEALPTFVDWLRRRRQQEELLELDAQKLAAAAKEDFAEALRLKNLASQIRDELSQFEGYTKGYLTHHHNSP